jgi:hypothetical protein
MRTRQELLLLLGGGAAEGRSGGGGMRREKSCKDMMYDVNLTGTPRLVDM